MILNYSRMFMTYNIFYSKKIVKRDY